MPINVTGPGKLRISAQVQQFGVKFGIGSADNPISSVLLTDNISTLDNDPSQPVVIFEDEEVLIQGTYRTSKKLSWLFYRVRAVVEVTVGDSVWSEITTMIQGPSDIGIALSARFRLQSRITAFRIRTTEGLRIRHESSPIRVHVKESPTILTFIAMGGSGSGGSSGSGSGLSSSSSSSSASSGSTSSDGIVVNPSRCGVDPRLISELMEAQNVQCNDLCANCLSFIEHLGLRILNEENLANHLQSLRHKEVASEPNFCADRRNLDGITHRIILGKWENSEHEPFRPPAIKTFESILDEYEAAGGGALIIVAQSHAGAKLAATVKDHWRWSDHIDVSLFVAWDATHLGGAITSLGQRPQRVLNFFQKDNSLWLQNGDSIAEADVEFNLTGCLSHNAIARSTFVHEETYKEVSLAIARIRAVNRDWTIWREAS